MVSIKKSLKRSIWCSPAIYFPTIKVLRFAGRFGVVPGSFLPPESYRSRGLANRETELVIEGFPRSGNSFAVTAMEMAQEESLRIAHHFHVPAQIIYACRHRIPVLVLIRKASDAVISKKIRTPSVKLDQSFRDWIRFYKCIIPCRDRYVIAEFEDITGDFGRVVDRINSKFGTHFNRFVHSEENRDKVFRRIKNWNTLKHGKIDKSSIATPSPARQKKKVQLLRELDKEKYSGLIEKADDVYNSLISTGS